MLAWVVGALVSFWPFWASRGEQIAGNFGDARLVLYFHEHWWQVLHGQAAWRAPAFFHPIPDALAYSVTTFLQALPYAAFRACGADQFLSYELSLLFFTLVGYIFTLLVLRAMSVPWGLSILGGVLFSFSNLFHVWVWAPHQYHALLTPVLVFIAIKGIRLYHARPEYSFLTFGLCGALLSLILFSEFYTGWFLVMFTFLWTLIISMRRFSTVPTVLSSIRRHSRAAAAACLLPFLFLTPFVLNYASAAVQTPARPLEYILLSQPQISELINVGSSNIVWGATLEKLGGRFVDWGWAYGLPPTLVVLFLVTTVFLIVHDRRSAHDNIGGLALSSAAVTVALIWAVLLIQPLWTIVWTIVPGAKAIRVIARFQFVLSFFVVIVSMAGLAFAWRNAVAPRKWARFAVIGAGAVLAAEQVTTIDAHNILRSREMALLAHTGGAPHTCQSFLIDDPPSVKPPLHPIGLQIDAMLLSQQVRIPTINGYSSVDPPHWNLNIPYDPDYLMKAARWASHHRLTGICAYRLATGRWDIDPFARRFDLRPNQPLIIHALDPRLYTVVGRKSGSDGITTTGKGGYLQYGPYIAARAGTYEVIWYGNYPEGTPYKPLGVVEVSANAVRYAAAPVISRGAIASDSVLATLRFSIEQDVEQLQCVFIANEGVSLSITKIEIHAQN